MSYKRIIHKFEHGSNIIESIKIYIDDSNVVSVIRKPREERRECDHIWKDLATPRSGKWDCGCSKCGALGASKSVSLS